MDDGLVLIGLISWVAAIAVGFRIGESKGRPIEGFVLALIIGWIGVFIVSRMREEEGHRRDRIASERRRSEAASASRVRSISDLPTRPALIAEALQRDPSLADSADPQAAQRLAQAVAAVEDDHRMRLGLDASSPLDSADETLADADFATIASIQAEAARMERIGKSWHHCRCGNGFKVTVNRSCPRCGLAIA